MSKSKPEAIKLTFASPVGPVREHRLHVDAGNSMAEAFVIDGDYRVVARGVGGLEARLKEGRYQVKYRVGNASSEEWVDLTKDRVVGPKPKMTVPESSAPIDPECWSDELLGSIQDAAAGCSLIIVVRDWEKPVPQATSISVIDAQGRKKRLEKSTFDGGKVALLRILRLPVGAYRIQVGSLQNSPVEMCVWVTSRFQTQIYFERRPINRLTSGMRRSTERAPHLATAAITMLSKDRPPLDEVRRLWLLTEMAKGSLAELRNVVPKEETREAVWQKFDCPMLGLLGGHLLLNALIREPKDAELAELMELVIKNLSGLLGANCPDVIALSFTRKGNKNFVVRMPPMLWQSWSLLAPNANLRNIPSGSLASGVGVALTAIRPWLVWKTTQVSQSPEAGSKILPSVERNILETKKTGRKIGNLAVQYSLPQSTVRNILSKLDPPS